MGNLSSYGCRLISSVSLAWMHCSLRLRWRWGMLSFQDAACVVRLTMLSVFIQNFTSTETTHVQEEEVFAVFGPYVRATCLSVRGRWKVWMMRLSQGGFGPLALETCRRHAGRYQQRASEGLMRQQFLDIVFVTTLKLTSTDTYAVGWPLPRRSPSLDLFAEGGANAGNWSEERAMQNTPRQSQKDIKGALQ